MADEEKKKDKMIPWLEESEDGLGDKVKLLFVDGNEESNQKLWLNTYQSEKQLTPKTSQKRILQLAKLYGVSKPGIYTITKEEQETIQAYNMQVEEKLILAKAENMPDSEKLYVMLRDFSTYLISELQTAQEDGLGDEVKLVFVDGNEEILVIENVVYDADKKTIVVEVADTEAFYSDVEF